MKTSDTSRTEDGVEKKNKHLNLRESPALRNAVQEQLPLNAASGEDVDGSPVQKRLSLGSRENKRSINRPWFEVQLARDPNNEYFSGKVITKECELTCLEGESEKGESHRSGDENEDQKSSAHTLQTQRTYQTDNVSLKPVVCDVGQDTSIVLFLLEAGKQTKPTNVKWKSVKIRKELNEPPHITKTAKGCKFKGQCLLEMYTIDRRKTIKIKPVKNRYKTITPEATTVSHTTTEQTKTNNIPEKNVSTNKENMPSKESFAPLPVTPAMMHTEMTTEGSLAETTIATTEAQGPSAGVSDQVIPGGVEGPTITMNPEPLNNYASEIREYITEMRETTTKTSLSGLRMKEVVQDIMDKLHKEKEKEITSVSWMEKGREADRSNPRRVLSKPLEAVHKGATDVYQKMTGELVPLCGGLIQRTEAGWKHCMERFRQPASMTFPFRAAPGAGKLEKEPARNSPPSTDDENDHFYFFNGVLKRVQNNFYPDDKRHRRRSFDNREEGVTREREKGDTGGNFLSYIQSLNERNKVKHLK
ncbi:uncharacterized protein LOC133454616 [Cololabis saira]|uniref:uncharacterized protein LOC133454616 n=1 Tax=Cololabis saira TaxID=129043 RepID=UPI002AD3DE29|nr:uncharacterized protein LOC133454616 [Cololabis saira]